MAGGGAKFVKVGVKKKVTQTPHYPTRHLLPPPPVNPPQPLPPPLPALNPPQLLPQRKLEGGGVIFTRKRGWGRQPKLEVGERSNLPESGGRGGVEICKSGGGGGVESFPYRPSPTFSNGIALTPPEAHHRRGQNYIKMTRHKCSI